MCFQYTRMFNPFSFWARAKGFTNWLNKDEILPMYCGNVWYYFKHPKNKIQNWNINQFFIGNDYNLHFAVVCRNVSMKMEKERKRRGGKSFPVIMTFPQIVCQILSLTHPISMAMILQSLLRVLFSICLTWGKQQHHHRRRRQIEVVRFLPIFRLIPSFIRITICPYPGSFCTSKPITAKMHMQEK